MIITTGVKSPLKENTMQMNTNKAFLRSLMLAGMLAGGMPTGGIPAAIAVSNDTYLYGIRRHLVLRVCRDEVRLGS